ncbi:MAG: UTRA domain-containing protein [Actinobacteria bacterium]|nr:UTRA domain-containing protein [Actinomycetota bacterium]
MTGGEGDDEGRAAAPVRHVSAAVLADRIAAALVHHEPGWRLPRLTALARRYNVSTAEVGAAIDQLAARHLLRRLPDGQVYRASPAEYLVPLEGMAGLASYVDPMGAELTCLRRHVSSRRAPEDIGRALGLKPGASVHVIRCLWQVGGEPAALSATYVPQRLASAAEEFASFSLGSFADQAAPGGPAEAADGAQERSAAPGQPAVGTADRRLRVVPQPAAAAGRPRAIQMELAPPPPSVARSLRLGAGQSVASLTVRFEASKGAAPVALALAMLRPDLFRVVVEAPEAAFSATGAGGFESAWTGAAEGWES